MPQPNIAVLTEEPAKAVRASVRAACVVMIEVQSSVACWRCSAEAAPMLVCLEPRHVLSDARDLPASAAVCLHRFVRRRPPPLKIPYADSSGVLKPAVRTSADLQCAALARFDKCVSANSARRRWGSVSTPLVIAMRIVAVTSFLGLPIKTSPHAHSQAFVTPGDRPPRLPALDLVLFAGWAVKHSERHAEDYSTCAL
jgi:hypothetical protein